MLAGVVVLARIVGKDPLGGFDLLKELKEQVI